MGPYEQFRAALRRSMDELLFNGVPPADAVRGAAEETTAALQRYNDENF
jgi:hypothetical protein